MLSLPALCNAESTAHRAPQTDTSALAAPDVLLATARRAWHAQAPAVDEARATSVYVALRRNGVRQTVVHGMGSDIASAIRNGAARLPRPDESGSTLIELMVPVARVPIAERGILGAADIALGLDGVEFQVDGNALSGLPWEIAAQRAAHAIEWLNRLCETAGHPREAWQRVTVWRTSWRHFLEDPTCSTGYVELHRNRRRFPEALTRSAIRERLRLLGAHVLQLQRPSGAFYYLYDPFSDRLQATPLNMVRMAGTAYAVARMAAESDKSDRPKYAKSAADACRFLLQHQRPFPGQSSAAYIHEPRHGLGKLGSTALTLLALETLPAKLRETFAIERAKLAAAVIAQQDADGRFHCFINAPGRPGGEDYYPGEALLALARDPHRRHSPTVFERAFPYYRAKFAERPNTAFVPWQVEAWATRYESTPAREYADFVFTLTDWLLRRQYPDIARVREDYRGGFGIAKCPGISSATYTEAVIIAYRLARTSGDDTRAARYRKAARRGLRFIMRLQITGPESGLFEAPSRALGGMTTSLTSFEMRIDHDQHAITCLLAALQAPELLDAPSEEGAL